MRKETHPVDKVKAIRGFYRVQLEQGGKIVGDSGYLENTITDEGFDDFLARLLANTTDSKQVRHMALGTGTAPNVTHTTLDGEIMASTKRVAVTVSISNSKTVRFTATFNSSDRTVAYNIRNIGLFNTTNTNATLFAGSTYASSTAATNQNVNATYDIQFS